MCLWRREINYLENKTRSWLGATKVDGMQVGEGFRVGLMLLLNVGRRLQTTLARRGGVEVAGWTLDRKIRVRFPAYPHRVWAIWWQGGKRRLRTSRCPCRGRLGTLKTPSCPWRGCPVAVQNLENWTSSHHYLAEISLNVTLNHNQQQPNNIGYAVLKKNVLRVSGYASNKKGITWLCENWVFSLIRWDI